MNGNNINEYKNELIDRYQQTIFDKYNIQDTDFESWIDNLYNENVYYSICYKCKESLTKPTLLRFENYTEKESLKNNLNNHHESERSNDTKIEAQEKISTSLDNHINDKKNCSELKNIQCEKKHFVKYSHVYHESVRGEKRKNLTGTDCKCCYEYFNDNLNSAKKNSRHKSKYEKPKTPPNFWDMDF